MILFFDTSSAAVSASAFSIPVKFPLKFLRPFLRFLHALVELLRLRLIPVVGVFAGSAPGRDLFGIQASLTTVCSFLFLVHRRSLDNHCELVYARPTPGSGFAVGKKATLSPGGFPPQVQGRFRNPFFLRNFRNAFVVWRKYFLSALHPSALSNMASDTSIIARSRLQ